MNFINDITVAPLSEAVKLANRLIRKQHPYTDTAGNPKYIYGQGNDEIAGLPFGMSKIEDSGCEVIAVYNAMIYLGDSELFPDVVRYFEDRGSFCGGLFGTHVNAIPQYFFEKGHSAIAHYASQISDFSDFDKALDITGAGIFSFFTGRNTLNVHTVFIIKNADGTISVYNDNNGCVTTTTYKSIEHYIQSGEYTPIVYYEIS